MLVNNVLWPKFDFTNSDDWNLLVGDLGETFFKHYSNRKEYAYARAEDVGWEFIHKKVIRFKKGFHRIDVRIPDELRQLLTEITEPNPDFPKTPAYSFDFITCVIDNSELETPSSRYVVEDKDLARFTIVEVKTRGSRLTRNELRVKQLCRTQKVRYRLYRIIGIDSNPVKEWDLRVEE